MKTICEEQNISVNVNASVESEPFFSDDKYINLEGSANIQIQQILGEL